MNAVGFSFFHIVVLMGLVGPVGVPLPDTPTISKVAPEQCLFYMSSAGHAEPQASSENQTEQLLAEPEVQKFAAQVETILKTLLDRGLQQPGAPPLTSEEITSLAKTLLSRPMAAYVASFDVAAISPDKPRLAPLHAGAIIHLGDKAAEFKALLEKITKLLPPQAAVVPVQDGKDTWQSISPDPSVTLTWGFKGEFFMVAFGEGEMKSLVKRAFGKTPAWLADLRKNSGVERISTVAYLNVKSILEIATPFGPPDAAKVFEAVGVSNLKNVTVVAGLDKTGFVTKTNLTLDGPAQGLFKFAYAKPLAPADLARVPADAVTAVAYRLDAEGIYDAVFKLIGQVEPKAAADMQGSIAQIESQFGLKLREDILQSLGDTVCIFNSAKEGGPIGGTGVIALKDSKKAKATHDKLIQLVQAIGQANPTAPKIQKTDFNGKELYSIQLPPSPVMPTWCLTDKELIVGAMPDKVKAYLSRTADFKSLAQSPDLAKTFQSGQGPVGMVYIDTKQVFDSIYPAIPMLMMMATPTLQENGINFNASMLPSANSIRPHLLPLVATVRRTSSGIEITERSSLPVSVVMSPANPMVIAFLLPAVQSARGAARVASTSNNIKEINLGMLNYADAMKRYPPAFKADKDGKPLLSWRVLILPFVEEGDLYHEFKLDEPWDSENNKKLIAKMPQVYKSPNGGKSVEGETNYLTVRGKNTIFNGGKGTKIAEVTDGTSNTIMVVEANDEKAVIWTKPDDFEYDENDPMAGLGGLQPGRFLVGFADGSVRSIANSIDAELLKALFTRNDGKAIDTNQIP